MELGKTIGSIALAGSLLTGCGGGKGNTNPDTNTTMPDTNTTTLTNHAPELLNSEEIILTTKEGAQIIIDLSDYKGRFSDPDGDELSYRFEMNGVEYDINSEGKVVITAPLVEATEEFEGKVIATDGKLDSEALSITLKSVDRADDTPFIFTKLELTENVINPIGNLVGSTDINDTDGIEYVEFSIGGIVLDNNKGDINNFDFNLLNLDLEDGNYSLVVKAKGKVKVDSENDNSNEIIKHIDFKIETPDTQAPKITLNGPSTITLTVGDTYTEKGAIANDNIDGNLTNEIIIDNSSVDTSVAGTYTVTYTVLDSSENEATVTRTVVVNEKVNHAPVLNSVSVSGENLIDHLNNFYSIPQKTNTEVTFKAKGSDEDGDNLQIEINGVLYNGTSKEISIFLDQDIIKEFHIREYDGGKYSNEILVTIGGR